MRPLTNPIRTYAWGSRTAIASLQRRPAPSPEPEAELWMGAHPSAPSVVPGEGGSEPLIDAIARNPGAVLGELVANRFGRRLPYLLKILAAAQPLSLQVHPDAEQARAGFAAEESAGLPRDARGRNYADPHHKPELLVALGEFDALCGFRDPTESATILRSYGVPALKPVIAALETGTTAERLRGAVELLVQWPASERAALVAAVAEAGGTPSNTGAEPLGAVLGRHYPGDVGVVIALLLNQVRLRPDEAVFVPAGNLHAHLAGFGVEVMAASDNVIRGGLTPKHVDRAELLRVLRYEVTVDPVVRPQTVAAGVVSWPVPVSEFALAKAVVSGESGTVALPGGGPRIVVCVRGSASLSTGGEIHTLCGGESVFVSASEPSVQATGEGVVFQAAPNAKVIAAA